MDASKQIFSSFIIHFFNIGMSILFANTFANSFLDTTDLTEEARLEPDECSFYFLSFVFDTVLGVFIVWILLKVSKQLATTFKIDGLKSQGFYGSPSPRMDWYCLQLVVFLMIIIISKIILGLMMYSVATTLGAIGSFIFQPLRLRPNTELVVVMVVCPCFLSGTFHQYNLRMNKLL